jgi:hypothetical protein
MADTIATRAWSDLTEETRRLALQCRRLERLARTLRAGAPGLGRLDALLPEGAAALDAAE